MRPDTLRPAAPDAGQPTSPTLAADVTVTGTKEAGANVEARWHVNAALVQDGHEIVPIDRLTDWSAVLPLQVGVNAYAFRSRDQAGNLSLAPEDTISVTRDAAVLPPTVVYAATTTVDRQVLTGTKEPGTAIVINGVVAVANDAATTWDAMVPLDPNPGDASFPRFSSTSSNDYVIEARDASSQTSTPVTLSIAYSPSPPVAAGELVVELELRSVWDYIGDEMRIRNLTTPTWDRVNLDAYSIEAWVEGPFTVTSSV